MKKLYLIPCVLFIVIFPIFCVVTVYKEEMAALPTTETATEIVSETEQETEKKAFEPLPVPLDADIQRYINQKCEANGIPTELVIALIWRESRYQADAISSTNDYGLMQINACNKAEIERVLNVTDLMNPYQNIKAGIYILGNAIETAEWDYNRALMIYNLGLSGAKAKWQQGIYSTDFSRSVLAKMNELEVLAP
jgi:soluble lytic murein transglycosylase-like protein